MMAKRRAQPLDNGSDQVELIESGPSGKAAHSSSSGQLLMFPPSVAQGDSSVEGPIYSDQSRVLRGGRHSKGLTRLRLPKGALRLYYDDLYHTLLNMPRHRFLMSFFAVYLSLYLFFAFFFAAIPGHCVGLDSMSFGRAFWFSVWTASTIGYSGDIGPDPDCHGVNMLLTFEIMVAALVDTMLMSLVFSRFAAPMPRATTIRFSTHAVLARHPGSRYWALTVRVANIRKHSLLDPEVLFLLAAPESLGGGGVKFRFLQLKVDDVVTQTTCLKLGLPATLTHVITPQSPLYNISVANMEEQGMELLCFMSGIDPMTSNMLQGQSAWRAADIRMNERFAGIQLATRKGLLGLDLSCFDTTTAAEVGMGMRNESQSVLVPLPAQAGQDASAIRIHMEQLRMTPLCDLTGAGSEPDSELLASETSKGGVQGGAQPVQGVALTAAGGLQQWDASVAALCDAIASDPAAAPAVRQQAAALRVAMAAAPARPEAAAAPAAVAPAQPSLPHVSSAPQMPPQQQRGPSPGPLPPSGGSNPALDIL